MKTWIIATIIVGVLVIATFGIVNFVKAEQNTAKTTETCTSCNNQCTKTSNCGLSTCNAISGKTCNCGR